MTTNYQLLDRIGQGGMGEVWRARHKMLGREAAIKLIRPETLADGSSERARITLRRFEKEARATAALRSPHTIELYDFGLTDDGTFFYAMELLEGYDLQSLVESHGPLPPARADPPAAPGLRVAGGGPPPGSGPPGRQAGQRVHLPARSEGGLRQGAGLGPGQGQRDRRG
ncbi:MAG: hypothetical protein QGH45_14590 [Myxococcota bacterium]|nr:hypothetical protein [Myxococcota bacterium]